MKVNFDAKILDLKNEPVKDDDGKTDATLGTVSAKVLLAVFPDEAQTPAKEQMKLKVARYELAKAVSKGGEQDVSVEDVAILKELMARAYGPLVVGRCYELIDPPAGRLKSVK